MIHAETPSTVALPDSRSADRPLLGPASPHCVCPMHFLYVSNTREHGYGGVPHVEDLIPAALPVLHRPFQAKRGFIPRRCLMTEVSLRPSHHASSAPLPVFFTPFICWQAVRRDITAVRSDKFLWA
jgi:hypothetical protein